MRAEQSQTCATPKGAASVLDDVLADTARLRAIVERRHKTTFWGRTYFVTPRLVNRIYGDGKKLVGIVPLNTRPNYYVVRVDSTWSPSNWDTGPTLGEHTDEMLWDIEEQFGRAWYDDDPPQRKRGRPFPALNDEVGISWFDASRWFVPANAVLSGCGTEPHTESDGDSPQSA